MKKYYIAIAVLVVVLVFIIMKSSCEESTSGSSSTPSSGLGGSSSAPSSGSTVDVTYYFNPGCPHCRNFSAAWKDFVTSGGANFTEINCATDSDKCKDVRGVPWVVFSKGGSSIPYTGSRDKESLKEFLNKM